MDYPNFYDLGTQLPYLHIAIVWTPLRKQDDRLPMPRQRKDGQPATTADDALAILENDVAIPPVNDPLAPVEPVEVNLADVENVVEGHHHQAALDAGEEAAAAAMEA